MTEIEQKLTEIVELNTEALKIQQREIAEL